LDKLISWAQEHVVGIERNEATTRLHLIDELLMNVLTWPRAQVRAEEPTLSTGRADYVLGDPSRQLVVEAKREGHSFRLPPETPVKTRLTTLFRLDPDLRAVIEQARGYASDFGLPYAAVTNGHQVVAFLATRTDGEEPLKGNALAFSSLEAMRDNFAALWDGLSKPGIESRRLSAMLIKDSGAPPPPKPSATITGYPGQLKADSLIADLRMLGELFLIDVADQPQVSEEFLRQCYLPSGALSQHAAVGKNILRARYSDKLEEDLGVVISPARTKEGVASGLTSEITARGLTARPIILLGYVGVGKTMFIRHLLRVEARDVLATAIVLYVDLGLEPSLEELEPFIAERFIQDLEGKYGLRIFDRDFLERVYGVELEAFRGGPWGEIEDIEPSQYTIKRAEYLAQLVADRAAHLRRSLDFLAEARGRRVVTILDNVDQRPAHVQDRVFLIAETLAKNSPGTVFVALRPDTFHRSSQEGTLSAYQPRVFAVDPPRIDRVLDKRLQFARSEISRRRADFSTMSNVEPLDVFLEILRLSLRRSRALAELIDNLSGQNAREALRLLTTIVGSSHVRPAHAVQRGKATTHYSIPFHEVLKAVMLGDRERFDPGTSRVVNLLDISSDDGREHFLLPIIIALLRRAAEPGVSQGFVSAERVFKHCHALGFRPEQVTWQLERSVAGRLAEASPLDGAPELYRATPVGAYTLTKLLADMTYLDEVSIDTPIVDDVTRALTQDALLASERVIRVDRFAHYLDQQWQTLTHRDAGFDWGVPRAGIARGVADLERRLARSAPTRKRPPERDG
jgi:hypothetical protein